MELTIIESSVAGSSACLATFRQPVGPRGRPVRPTRLGLNMETLKLELRADPRKASPLLKGVCDQKAAPESLICSVIELSVKTILEEFMMSMGRAKFPGELPGEKGKRRKTQFWSSVKRVVSTNDNNNITGIRQAVKRHEVHDDVS